MLFSETIPNLCDAEKAKLHSIQKEAKKDRESEAHLKRYAWAEKQADKSVGTSASAHDKELTKQRFYKAALEGTTLPNDLILHSLDGDTVRAEEVFANPDKWHEKRFSDPFEPDYRDDSRIAVAVLKGCSNPHIHSHAHGGVKYFPDNKSDFSPADFNQEKRQSTKEKFKIEPASEFMRGKPPKWRIKSLIPETGLAMIFGEPGSAKTFYALELAITIATAREQTGYWMDRYRIFPGKVIYIAAEGASGCRSRMEAHARKHNVDINKIDLHFISDCPNLYQGDDFKILTEKMENHGGADVIIIDTFARTTAGADENTGKDIGPILDKCAELAEKLGALIVFIHHSGKDKAKGSRGWSGLKAPLVTEIEIKKLKDCRRATFSKQKDGEDGQEFDFRLVPVFLGFDEDGEEVTNCVVEFLSQNKAESLKDNVSGKYQKAILKTAESLFSQASVFSKEELLKKTIEIIPYDPGNEVKPKRDSRPDSAKRTLDQMIANGHLAADNNMVTLPHFAMLL